MNLIKQNKKILSKLYQLDRLLSLILKALALCAFLLFLLVLNSIFANKAHASTIYENTEQMAATFGFGWSNSFQKLADNLNFTANVHTCSIFSKIANQGSATDGVLFKIYQGGDEPEDGPLVATTDEVSHTVLPTHSPVTVYTEFPIPGCFTFQKNITYWLVSERTGSLQPTSNSNNSYHRQGNSKRCHNIQCRWAYFSGHWDEQSQHSSHSLKLDGEVVDDENPQPQALDFIAPSQDSINEKSNNFIFSGTCLKPGPSRLRLDFIDLQVPDEDQYFDIDCDVDFTWHTTRPLQTGYTHAYIMDRDWARDHNAPDTARVDFTVVDSIAALDWRIDIVYPEDSSPNSHHYFIVQPNPIFGVRFAYTIPGHIDPREVGFYIDLCTNLTYSDCDSLTTGSIQPNYDPELLGAFNVSVTGGIHGETNYFKAKMVLNSETKYSVNFALKFDSNSVTSPEPPQDSDLGFWGSLVRRLFIPHPNFFGSYADQYISDLKGKAPFSYFYKTKDLLMAQSVGSQSFSFNITMPVEGQSLAVASFDSNESHLASLFTTFRPIFVAAAWLLFFLPYLVTRFKNINL